MEELREMLKRIKEEDMKYERFPDIPLYMDQLISILSSQRDAAVRKEKLTSAMVNNYIKDSLIPRAKGKRYSREHLAYLSLFTKLKQNLSVKDAGILTKATLFGGETEEKYDKYLSLLKESLSELSEKAEGFGDADMAEFALRCAIESHVCRLACEFLIDKMNNPEDEKEALPQRSK